MADAFFSVETAVLPLLREQEEGDGGLAKSMEERVIGAGLQALSVVQ